jgi:hypothetical protein
MILSIIALTERFTESIKSQAVAVAVAALALEALY